MAWNYRIMKRVYEHDTPDPEARYEDTYRIHEVYYDEAGKPDGCTVNPTYISGEDLEELKADLTLYLKAFDKPVLDYHTLEDTT